MGDHARRKKGADEHGSVGAPGLAPGFEAFWAGAARGIQLPLIDPRVPGVPADPTALLPYIDRDHEADPVAMAAAVTAQLTESAKRSTAFTAAHARQVREAHTTATAIADVVGRDAVGDEDSSAKLLRLLAGKTPAQIQALRAAFREQTRGAETLDDVLDRSLDDDDRVVARAALTGDAVLAASVAIERARGDAPRLLAILRPLTPAQIASLQQRFPATTVAWMSVPVDHQAEINALLTGRTDAARGARVADLLRDPLHGAALDGVRPDAQTTRDFEARATPNVLRELATMSPADLAKARAEWDAAAPARGEKTWDAMIEERFASGDPLTYARIRALATGNTVEATALALSQGLRDHDQATIESALANPDLSSPDPAKRAAAREHARAVAARFQDIDRNAQVAIAAAQGHDPSTVRGTSLDTALARHYAHAAAPDLASPAAIVETAVDPVAQAARRKKRARATEVGTDELREAGVFSTATEIHRARDAGDEARVATLLEDQRDRAAVDHVEVDYARKYGDVLFPRGDTAMLDAYREYQALRGTALTYEQAAYATRDSSENRVEAVRVEGPRAVRSDETQARLDTREDAHEHSEDLAWDEFLRTQLRGRPAGAQQRRTWALASETEAVGTADFAPRAQHLRAMADTHREEKAALAERAARWISIGGKLAALVTLNPTAMLVIDALVGFASIYVKSDVLGPAYKTGGAELLDVGITALNDLAMLPIGKLESTLARTATLLGLTSGTIVLRNDLEGRSAETTIDLVKNLIMMLVANPAGDKLEEALGGVRGKAVNILGNAAANGAAYGSDATTLLDAAGGHLAKKGAHHASTEHAHARPPAHAHVVANGHYAEHDSGAHSLHPDEPADAARLAELRRRRAAAAHEEEASYLDRDIAALEERLAHHDAPPDAVTRHHAAPPELATHGSKSTSVFNDDARYQTRAELVPGSEFRGRGTGRPDEVHAASMQAVEAILRRYPDVVSVQRADAARAQRADQRAHLEATYVVTLRTDSQNERSTSFTIRIAVGPHEGETVARAVINPSQQGRTHAGGQQHDIRGRYVIQLSDELDPSHVERAVAHEIAELRAVRDMHDQGRYAGVDSLRRGSLSDELSPHDLGRLAELDVLTRHVDLSRPSSARIEILALINHMGLREGEPGADARLALAKPHLSPDAARAVEALRKPHDQLPADVADEVHGVRERAERDHADEQARDARRSPMHDLPSSLDENGQPLSRDALAARAAHAEEARHAKSEETWANLEALATAAAPGELPLLPFDVQIGAGASMAARDRNHLVIDDRGRWQQDGNREIAQTATQTRGTKDANLGDATHVAKPDRRVPIDAISYWEDNIAAQGPVVNGRAALSFGDKGELVLTITKGGRDLKFRVSKVPYVATGFPPEKLTGSKYGKSVRETANKLQTLLGDIAHEHEDEAVRTAAADALAKIKTTRFVSNADATQFEQVLANPTLRAALSDKPEALHALALSEAAAHFGRIIAADDPEHRHVFLGDQANLGRQHALNSHNWVIAGTGGTAVSAAEIVLGENVKAHVTMVGADEPDGLMQNDQFLAMARRHADDSLAARLAIPAGDGRLSVAEPQYVGRVETSPSDGKGHGPTWVDESDIDPSKRSKTDYDVNGTQTNAVGTAYIAAIGRENDFPPIVAALVDDARRRGYQSTVVPIFHDRQYVGYTVTVTMTTHSDKKSISVDVTGAASRFVPESARSNWTEEQKRDYIRSMDWDAPPESGRFAGGLEASARQADLFAQARRENPKRNGERHEDQ